MLKKLHVENFKSLADFTCTFGTNNVIVGPNMSGKSNVVDVFRFFADILLPPSGGVSGLAQAFSKRNGFSEVIWKGGDSNVITFELEGEVQPGGDPDSLCAWRYKLVLL